MQFPCYQSNGKLVCLNLDEEKIKAALEVFVLNAGPAAVMKVEMTNRGVRIDIEGRGTDEADDKLAGKIIYMHGGSCRYGDGCVSVVLPYPTLSGESAAAESADGWKEDMPVLAIGGFPPFSIGKTTGFSSENGLPRFAGAVFWSEDFYGQKASAVLSMLVSDPYYRKLPFLCCPPRLWSTWRSFSELP